VTGPNEAFRRARARLTSPDHTGQHASRQELAELVNAWVYANTDPPRTIDVTADYIGQLERGRFWWPQDPDRRAGLRAVLGAETDAELGFRRPRRPDRAAATVDDVDRNEFLRLGVGLGVGALAGSSLVGLLTPTQPSIPHTVARDQIDEIVTADRMFVQWDHQYGGGVLARRAMATQLEYCGALMNARIPDRLRPEFYAALCELAHTGAFMAFDACDSGQAQRLYVFALRCAEESGDWTRRASVLADLARQAWWRGDYDTALTHAEQASVRADRLTATQRAIVHSGRAQILAKLGRTQDALTAVGKSDEEFAHHDPRDDPSYNLYYTEAEHYSETGHALADLGDAGQRQADTRLSAAVAGFGDSYPRSRAFARITLATATMTTGDPHHAVTLATDAITAAKTIHSQRLASALRNLHSAAARHQQIPAVAHLRDAISTITASR